MFNPLKASKAIKEEFANYIDTAYRLRDPLLRSQFESSLENFVSNGPFLEMNSVFEKGHSIASLIDEGVLSPLFAELESGHRPGVPPVLPLNRPLYRHQEKAIRQIVGGNNAVITTGTGSGKTNCFLIPVINELLREKEKETLGPGIRAMIIYPMNALANDQVKNLRKILMDYPDITFGVYNGGTENKEEDAISLYRSMFAGETIEKLRDVLPNELVSRDRMKETPPNILFTNYAMLEHLLFRPADDVIFSGSSFRYVVLDESHVYSGATGIETSMLLRRLKARIHDGGDVQFILTSATLGTGPGSDDDIVRFAKNLTGSFFNESSIIRSSRVAFEPSKDAVSFDPSLFLKLADEKNSVSEVLDSYGIEHIAGTDEEILFDFLPKSLEFNRLRSFFTGIGGKSVNLKGLWESIGLSSEEELISLVSLASKARRANECLVDARYHFFVRGLEGAYVSLVDGPKLYLTRKKEDDKGDAVFEIAICNDCGDYALVGKTQGSRFVQASRLDRDTTYLHPIATGGNEEKKDEEKTKRYLLCPHCGAIVEERRSTRPCDHDPSAYVLVEARKTGDRCLACDRNNSHYSRFYLGNDAATSVLAVALYEELPETIYRPAAKTSSGLSHFSSLARSLPPDEEKKARQFLIFSDSRQEAAKFACYLADNYKEFLRRRGICHILQARHDDIKNGVTIDDLVGPLKSYFCSKRTFAASYSDQSKLTDVSESQAWVALLNELSRATSPTSLASLGFMQFSFEGASNAELINAIVKWPGVNISEEDARSFVNLLAFEFVKAGAVVPADSALLSDDDREYIFYTPIQRGVFKNGSDISENLFATPFLPSKRKNGSYILNNRVKLVQNFLKLEVDAAIDFLSEFWDYVLIGCCGLKRIAGHSPESFAIPTSLFKILVPGMEGAHWYFCEKCGRISAFCHEGHRSDVSCGGVVHEVDPLDLQTKNHYAALYNSKLMSPLFVKEHTAQLSREESLRYQEEFIKKEINALSCSTTFEMGVDVGDLETVFLRNIPPLPSNYAQRAGRAGRSLDAAAYCLTYARTNSHDLNYFKNPTLMIDGIINPPVFKLDNEKIVRRHIYDVALSMYFSDHPEQYAGNRIEMFINKKGYEDFEKWLLTRPVRLLEMLKASIPDVNDLHKRLGITDFSWLDSFIGPTGTFTTLISEYDNNVTEFNGAIESMKKAEKWDEVNRIARRLKLYQSSPLIEFLVRGNILPHYGFPVDTVELEVKNNVDRCDLRLARDLSLAIAEYAPSSEVIANGKMYTSRYIRRTAVGAAAHSFHTSYIAKCSHDDCGAINFRLTDVPADGVSCASCGRIIERADFSPSIEPRAGFLTEGDGKRVPMGHQQKNYRSEDIYIGNAERRHIETIEFQLGGIPIVAESSSNDSLLIRSVESFYVCPVCGYSLCEDEKIEGDLKATKEMANKANVIHTKRAHRSFFGSHDCSSHDLQRFGLHHVFNTDVVKLSFGIDTSDYKTMLSAMYALLFAATDLLSIERSELKAVLAPSANDGRLSYSIVFYDAVPGGAGYARKIIENEGDVIEAIFNVAYRNMVNCDCNPSCYKCLRSYENQRAHDSLDRFAAIDFLSHFVEKNDVKEEKLASKILMF